MNAGVTRAVGVTSTFSVGAAGTTVAARGFGGTSVSLLYDGVRSAALGGSSGWPYDVWTVERIEVLNGPASVLHGIGGIGGSINVVPRRPSSNAQHTAQVSAGSLQTYKLAFDSTGPISDRVLYRFDVSRQQSAGYINRGHSESTAVAGSLAFRLSDRLKLTILNDWTYIEPMNYNGLPSVNGEFLRSLRKENYGASDENNYFNENSTRAELEWILKPDLSLRSTTSLLHGDRIWHQCCLQLNSRPAIDAVAIGGFGTYDQDQIQWNQQVDVTWRKRLAGRANSVVVGGNVEDVQLRRIVTLWPGQTVVASLRGAQPVAPPPTPGVINPSQNNLVNSYSIFAEDRLELTPALSVVGGLRFDSQHFERVDLVTPVRSSMERTDNPVNWRVGAVYEVRRDTSVYAQYSKATDGIRSVCCITAAQMAFDPSRGQQVEVGIKQSTGGGRLEWTLAGYRIVKKDLLIADPIMVFNLIQVGSQSSQGVEATASADVGWGLRIGANGTVLKPVFEEFFENVGGVRTSRNGNRPTNVPWQSGNLFATWSFRHNWLAQGALRFVGRRYIDTANALVMPAYRVVDAGLRRSLSGRTAIDFRVSNLFDAFYAYNFTGNGLGGGNWNIGAPRTVEVALTAGF